VTPDPSEEHLQGLEHSRAALAEALRAVSLEPVARALDVLPPAGVDGWVPAWTASLGFAKTAAERWGLTVRMASTCAVTGKEREKLAHLGRELATVVKEAFVLVERLANAADA
jgi:hypothetical protein